MTQRRTRFTIDMERESIRLTTLAYGSLRAPSALAASLGTALARPRRRPVAQLPPGAGGLVARAMPLAPASCARSRMLTALPSNTFLSPRRITIFSLALSSASFSAPGRRASETALPSTSTSPSAVTVTETPVGVVDATAELGRSTSLPWFEMTLVVTMKMIRRTRKMSVSGVMLISATMPSLSSSSPPPLGRDRAAMPDLLVLLLLEGRRGRLDVEQRLHQALARAREQTGDRADAHLQPVERRERD